MTMVLIYISTVIYSYYCFWVHTSPLKKIYYERVYNVIAKASYFYMLCKCHLLKASFSLAFKLTMACLVQHDSRSNSLLHIHVHTHIHKYVCIYFVAYLYHVGSGKYKLWCSHTDEANWHISQKAFQLLIHECLSAYTCVCAWITNTRMANICWL